MKYSSIECFLRDAIYLMGFDPKRYTTKRGRILVTEVKNFLEDYYIKKGVVNMLSNFSYNMWVFLGSFMLVVLLLVIAILISISMHYLHESLKDLKKREGEDKEC